MSDKQLIGEVNVDFSRGFTPAMPKIEEDIVKDEPGFDPISGEENKLDPQPAAEPEPDTGDDTGSSFISPEKMAEILAKQKGEEPSAEPETPVNNDGDPPQEGGQPTGEEGKVDYDEYSTPAMLAMKAIQDGHIDGEYEVKKDMTFEDLMNNLYTSKEKIIEETKAEYIEQLDQYKEYVEMMASGATQEQVQGVAAYDQILAVDTENEENQRALLTYQYESKGLSKEETENLVEDHISLGRGKEKADAFKQFISNEKTKYIQQTRDSAIEKQRLEVEARNKMNSEIDRLITGGNIVNFALDSKEQKQLKDALYKPTEVVEYVDQSGNTRKTKITKYESLQREIAENPELQLAVVKFMLDGFKMKNIETNVRNDINNEINAALDSRLVSKPSRQTNKDKRTPPKDAVILGNAELLGEIKF